MKIQEIDYSVDVMKALLWQYNDAVSLQSLLQSKQDWYNQNQEQFWSDWYTNVFDLRTANEFGLTVWYIILDIPIIVSSAPPVDPPPAWGFEDTHKNFNHGNFFGSSGGVQTLTVAQARTVLRMRYFQITSRGTIPEINNFLEILFGDLGGGYVLDNLDMTMEYHFNFPLDSKLAYIFESYDILPRPAGVSVTYSFAP